MKIMTVLGTRPEIIRLSRVIAKLDKLCDHVLVHTGQNFDPNLSDIFFSELKVRKPDHYLGVKGDSFGQQAGRMLEKVDAVMAKEKPDRLLILGDTNSGLSAILAKRRGIPVFHMEAGNRCYDDRVPEEVNRRVIDHSSDILMPYTERSRQNLLKEGIEGQRIFVTGNPILEVINHYEPEIAKSQIHKKLGLKKKKYFLVTLHRAENVDLKPRLKNLLEALDRVQKEYKLPLILSLHPHTRQKIAQFVIKLSNPDIRFIDPPGFFLVHRPGTQRLLRPLRQRHGPGRVLHLQGAQCHSPRCHRASGNQIEIGGKPILWHIMKIYSHYGFREFVICLGYKGQVIKDYFHNFNRFNSDFTVDLRSGELHFENCPYEDWQVTLADTGLDTLKGGRIKRIEKYIDSDINMLTYGDGVADIDIEALLDFQKSHGKLLTVTGVKPPSMFGEIIEKERQGRFFRGKAPDQQRADLWRLHGFQQEALRIPDSR